MRRSIVAGLVIAVLGGLGAPASGAASEQVLVRFDSGVPQAAVAAVLRSARAVRIGEVYGTDVLVVRGPSGTARRLDSAGVVDYAEVDAVLRRQLSGPNDPQFSSQYALTRVQALAGWASYPGSFGGPDGPTIAIVDSGIDEGHEDLSSRIDRANSKCFGTLCLIGGYNDDNGHGTHTAGTAAATANNGKGVAGVAYNARIMALKVCGLLGSCNTSDVSSAILWASDHGAKVISMSLGGSSGTQTLENAVRKAFSSGAVIVAAAGNDGNGRLNYPAAYPDVISVGATDKFDKRASFSNANTDVELSAPGVSVLSTYPGGYRTLSGTSMSTPHVAGLAALLFGQHPDWTNVQVRSRMQACADDLGTAGRDPQFGFGRINLARALSGAPC